MRGKNLNKKQKNILIGGLLAIVVLMAVGYAAFSASLNINGTASVSSTWDIKITSVTAKNVVGSASDNTDVTTFSNLSATVAANLVSPGDSISYDIVVTNNGSVAAKLDTITGPTSNNAAITMSKSGLTAGDTISAGSTKTLTVTIGYSSGVTSQPNSTTAASTISLSFSQYVAPSGPTYVYALNTNALYYATGSHPILGSYTNSSSSSINISYSSLAAMNTATGKKFGLKYGIENELITEAYICFLHNSSEELCLQGSIDGSTFAANKQILNEKLNCDCTDSSECYCSEGELIANTTSEGYININDGTWNCYVNNVGSATCYDY